MSQTCSLPSRRENAPSCESMSDIEMERVNKGVCESNMEKMKKMPRDVRGTWDGMKQDLRFKIFIVYPNALEDN